MNEARRFGEKSKRKTELTPRDGEFWQMHIDDIFQGLIKYSEKALTFEGLLEKIPRRKANGIEAAQRLYALIRKTNEEEGVGMIKEESDGTLSLTPGSDWWEGSREEWQRWEDKQASPYGTKSNSGNQAA